MKKIFVAIVCFVIFVNFSVCQAENDFDLNKNFHSQFQPVTNIFWGVVKVKTYLSLREQPNVNSREIMRLPNGATIMFRESFRSDDPVDWLIVLSVSFNGKSYSSDADVLGYVHKNYVEVDLPEHIY